MKRILLVVAAVAVTAGCSPSEADRSGSPELSPYVDESGAPLYDEGVEPGENDGAGEEDQPGDGG